MSLDFSSTESSYEEEGDIQPYHYFIPCLAPSPGTPETAADRLNKLYFGTTQKIAFDIKEYICIKLRWTKWRDIIFSYLAGTAFAFAWLLWIDAQVTSARKGWDPETTWWHWMPGLISTFGLCIVICVSWIHPEGDFLFTPIPESPDMVKAVKDVYDKTKSRSEDSDSSDSEEGERYFYRHPLWIIIARVLMFALFAAFIVLLIGIGAAIWVAIQWFFIQALDQDAEAFYPGIAIIVQTLCICCSAICFRVGVSVWVPLSTPIVNMKETRDDWYL